jgi:hypothetical protein
MLRLAANNLHFLFSNISPCSLTNQNLFAQFPCFLLVEFCCSLRFPMVLGVALGAVEEGLIAITAFQWEQEK